MNNIKAFGNTDELAAAAAEYVLEAARQSIKDHGTFSIALAGGSTPRKLYALLAGRDAEWSKWQFFMSDERYVPHDDGRSNQKLANETLLNELSIDPGQIHAVPVEEPSAEQAARRYEDEIHRYFNAGSGKRPAFDLILLGMGSDAHTASLFPGKPALEETYRLVVASKPGVLPPPVDRVTFTLPLINAARRVLFMAAGADKAEAFQKVRRDLEHSSEQTTTPAGMVCPESGELLWFVDRATAAA